MTIKISKLISDVSGTTRCWVLAACLSVFGVIPSLADMYYPNTGLALKRYLATRIFGTSDTSSLLFSIVWAVFIDLSMFGPLCGMLIIPSMTEKFGRVLTIRWALIGCVTGHLMEASAGYFDQWVLLFIGRFAAMLFFGIFMVTSVLILSEASPLNIRGNVVTTLLLGMSLGTLLGTIFGLESTLGSDELWPMAFVIIGLLHVPAVPLTFYFPDSPVFLLAKRTEAEAIEAQEFYQGPNASLAIAIDDAKQAEMQHQGTGCTAFITLLRLAPLRRPLKVSLAILVAASVIEVVNNYSTTMLIFAGFSDTVASYCTIAMKVVSVFSFVVCIVIVDKVGRRPLLIFGCLGTIASFILAGIFQCFSNHKWGSMCFCIAIFSAQIFINICLRPMKFVTLPEMFPHRFRATGKSFSVFCGFVYKFFLVIIFYVVLCNATACSYFMIAAVTFLAFVYIARSYPETKRKLAHEAFPELMSLNKQADSISSYGAIDNCAKEIDE